MEKKSARVAQKRGLVGKKAAFPRDAAEKPGDVEVRPYGVESRGAEREKKQATQAKGTSGEKGWPQAEGITLNGGQKTSWEYGTEKKKGAGTRKMYQSN